MRTDLNDTAGLQSPSHSDPGIAKPDAQGDSVTPGKSAIAVLVVDDNDENLWTMRAVLKPLAVHIVEARNGPEALKLVLQGEYACVLLDVHMPDMDGYEVARLMGKDAVAKHIPILFATAQYSDSDNIARGYSSGAADYLVKPLNPAIVRSKVSVFLELFKRKRELEEANLRLERFAGLAAHDLEAPLRRISTMSAALLKSQGSSLGDESKECLDLLVEGSERLKRLIADLLAFSRAGTLKVSDEVADLNAIVQEVTKTFADRLLESKATFHCAPLPTVRGSAVFLHQVMQNLIGNAIKFMPPGRSPIIHVNATDEESCWKVSVMDNGVGVEPKHHGKIFEGFFRVHSSKKYPGSGLGLAFCAKVIQAHGGKIWVEPHAEGGLFSFTLPK